MAKGSVSFFPVDHDPWANLPKGPTEARQGPMSWTDYLPFVKEAVKIYGKEKLGEILGAVTAPGDAVAGKLDPGTPEGLKRVQALAGLAMGGPAKPQGTIGAGWQAPITEVFKTLGKDSPIFKPESYNHPHTVPLISHPAIYGMDEPEARAASELLEAMKLYPDQYKTPKEAAQGLVEFAEPHELPHFASAMKKLGDWAGEHKFKFEEAPKPSVEDKINSLPGFHGKSVPYTPPKTVSIEEALYPINWADLHSAVRRPGQEATGQYAETLRRAEALGFNTNFPLYHGAADSAMLTPSIPAEGIWGPKAEEAHAFFPPKEAKTGERGIFTADTPEIAAQYSGGHDAPEMHGQTFPLFANPKKTLAVDWTAVSGNPSYNFSLMDRLIEAAHKQEADALVVQGMRDMGGPQNQYVFLRPNVLRSQFAMFDPKKVDSPNLLHAGGLGAMPMFVPVDHNPFEEPTQ